MDKEEVLKQVREINEMMGHTGYQYIREFDIRYVTPTEFASLDHIARAVAARKKYMQARGLPSIDAIPLDDLDLL